MRDDTVIKSRPLERSTKMQPVSALDGKGVDNSHIFFKNSDTDDADGMTKYSVDITNNPTEK